MEQKQLFKMHRNYSTQIDYYTGDESLSLHPTLVDVNCGMMEKERKEKCRKEKYRRK